MAFIKKLYPRLNLGSNAIAQTLYLENELIVGDIASGTTEEPGMIKWNGTNFQGYTGTGGWIQLDFDETSVPVAGVSGDIIYNNNGSYDGFGNWDNTLSTLTIEGATTNRSFVLKNAINQNSYNFGSGNTLTSDSNTFIHGTNNTSGGDQSFIFGISNTSTSPTTYILGSDIDMGSNNSGTIAIGTGHIITNNSSYGMIIGRNNKLEDPYSFVGGYNNEIPGSFSISYGQSGIITGDYAYGFGNNIRSAGQYSMSVGYNTSAAGLGSFAMGRGNSVTYPLLANATGSFNLSYKTASTNTGALASYSGIFAGVDGTIPSTSTGSVLLASNLSIVPASTTYTAFAPKFYSLEAGAGITMLSSNSTSYAITVSDTGIILVGGNESTRTWYENDIVFAHRSGLNIITNGISVLEDDDTPNETRFSLKFAANVDVDISGIQDGDLLMYNAGSGKIESVQVTPDETIIYSVEANISSDDILSTIVPAGYKIDCITVSEIAGFDAGNINIGVSNGTDEIVSSHTITANLDKLLPLGKEYFSRVNDTDLYISSSLWGTGIITLYFTFKKI